jgi:hypothetical protein
MEEDGNAMSLNRKCIQVKLRTALALGCFVVCSAAPASRAWAAETAVFEGSTLTYRSVVDGDSGQVYIYIGGAFPAGTNLSTFKYLFDHTGPEGNTSGYITPLLFTRELHGADVLYTVVGIGRGFTVDLNSAPGTILFDVVEGIKVPTNGLFTFGYVNAFVDANGNQRLRSPGTVDMDESLDGGEGVGGAGTTNAWATTAQGPPFPTVGLGTTFGVYGSGADFGFFTTSRTYSAVAVGIVASSNY